MKEETLRLQKTSQKTNFEEFKFFKEKIVFLQGVRTLKISLKKLCCQTFKFKRMSKKILFLDDPKVFQNPQLSIFSILKFFSIIYRHIFQIKSPSCNSLQQNPIKILSIVFAGQKKFTRVLSSINSAPTSIKNSSPKENRVKIASNEAEINFPIIKVRLAFCSSFSLLAAAGA